MVVGLLPYVLATAVALRPTMEVSDLNQTSGVSPAVRVTVLEEAEAMISDLTSDGQPPSLSADTIEALQGIIAKIEGQMIAEMTAGHNGEVAELQSAARAVSACNDALRVALTPGGSIGESEQKSVDHQTAFTTAIEQVSLKDSQQTAASAAFVAHMESIQTMPICAAFPATPVEEVWASYFSARPDLAVFDQQKATWEEQRDSYKQAKAAFEAASLTAAAAKGALQDSFCNTIAVTLAGCRELKTCRANAMAEFEVVKAKAEDNAKLRVDAFAAGQVVIAQVKRILGEPATDDAPTHSFDMAIPVLEPQDDCSTEPFVGKPIWEDFLVVAECEVPAPATQPKYAYGEVGSLDGCPSGYTVMELDACLAATEEFGYGFHGKGPWAADYPGCMVRAVTGDTWFNTHPNPAGTWDTERVGQWCQLDQ